MDDMLFVSTGRWVAALDRTSGRPIWRRKLPRWFASGPATLLEDNGILFVGRGGYLYCIDSANGEVLWERGIASGSHAVLMTLPGMASDQSAAIAAVAAAQAQASAGAAASSG
jgi:outer membrane protein assembly factor BamB